MNDDEDIARTRRAGMLTPAGAEAGARYQQAVGRGLRSGDTRLYEVRYRIAFHRGRRYVFAKSAVEALVEVDAWVESQPSLCALRRAHSRPGVADPLELTVEPKE